MEVMDLIKTPKVENVRMLDRYSKGSSQGTLYLTATHLIFNNPDDKKETWVLYTHIASIEKQPLSTTGSPILIRTKNFLSVTFVVPKERDCHDIYVSLTWLSQPSSFEDLYCFMYTPTGENLSKNAGWNFFDLQHEYQRMGVPNEQWVMTQLNENYELCDTYPSILFVPASAQKSTLIGSSKFRSKGRLPALSYLHKNKASICRCSQPLSGFNARCMEDEKMLNNILRTNPNATFMYVVDTRPKINAMANRAAGKGYENEAFYENIKFHFLGVENIHVMRNSLLKIVETSEQKNPTMTTFLNGLESSGWLKHIKSILDTSQFIADAIEEGISVVVHCSDGWDRTAQVCSLAALLLDPYYRTFSGFQALIEKDWLAFGHKFSERCGHIQAEGKDDSKEVSPVFTQLLDATWQLMQMFPCSFQFNENFLITIHYHVHACQFGTFVGNCEKERVDLRLSERTYSLWGYMANNLDDYLNPIYLADESPGILKPQLIPQNIKFWRGMYYRFESGVHPREPAADLLLATSDHSFSLDEHVKFLTKKITSMKSLLMKSVEKRKGKPPARPQLCNNVQLDNKLAYNQRCSTDFESADHDHPLKVDEHISESPVTNGIPDGSQIDQLTKEIDSVALDWKALRNTSECSCSLAFDHVSRKNHCRKCGDIFCTRCITKQATLPGHATQKPVPVCKPCYDLLIGATDS